MLTIGVYFFYAVDEPAWMERSGPGTVTSVTFFLP